MKGTWFKLLGLMLGLVLTVQAWGQSDDKKAFYVYRNDGQFNAFFHTEIDSIVCSPIDLDSVWHDYDVVQEFWTEDSVYRIPIASIDSVGFVTPEVILSDKVVRMESGLLDYLLRAEGMDLFFSGDLPHDQRPNVGDILVCTDFENPHFEEGFVGKVYNGYEQSGEYVVECDTVTDITEIFKQLIAVEELTVDNPAAVSPQTKGVWNSAVIPVGISMSCDFGDDDEGASVYGGLNGQIRAKVVYNITDENQFVGLVLNHDWSLSAGMNVSTSRNYSKPVSPRINLMPNVHFPAALPVLKFTLYGNLFVQSSGSIELGVSMEGPTKRYVSSMFYNNGQFQGNHRELATVDNSSPTFSSTLSLNGSFQIGTMLEVYIGSIECMGYVKSAIDLFMGPKFTGNLSWNASSASSFDYYNTIKDSKIAFSLLAASAEAYGEASYFGHSVKQTFLSVDLGSIGTRECYLFPEFSDMESDGNTEERTARLTCVPSRGLLMPLTLGLGLYDKSGQLLDSWFSENTYWYENPFSTLDHTFDYLDRNKEYEARPLIKFNGGIIPAVPEKQFTLECGATTGAVKDITSNSAMCAGEIDMPDEYQTLSYGICYSDKSSQPRIGNAQVADVVTSEENFSVQLSDLKDGTTYYYCAYLSVDGKSYYGEVRQFTTKKAATVRTTDASSITTSTAVLSGIVSGLSGSSSDCSYGFFYGTGQIPSVDGQEVRVGTSHEGSYTCSLSGLTENTTYYFCAYLLVDGQYRYGDVLSFRTNGSLSVQTLEAGTVTETSAVLSGSVSGISGSSSDCRYGFFYGTTTTPYSGGQDIQVGSNQDGNFSYSLSGLAENTTYYYCAYLWIDGRFSYGEVYSFTTEKASPVKTLGTVSVKSTSATLSGSVYGVAGSYSECSYGFCYGTSPKPYVDGEEVEAGTYEDGEYTFSLYDLDDMTTYYYCAYLSIDGEYSYGEVLSFTTPKSNTDITPGQYVDLGLSVKWTSCNIGADAPEEYGGYYSWGEVSEKDDYSWGNYTYYDMVQYKWIKIGTNISGTEYDVARYRLGIDWRMPTREEWTELVEKCEWEWITYKGTKGQKVTGPNGNSIFFPAAGHRIDDLFVGQGTGGEYWSGTLYEGSSLAIWYNGMAYLGAFSDVGSYMIYYTRDVGRSVRAVLAH